MTVVTSRGNKVSFFFFFFGEGVIAIGQFRYSKIQHEASWNKLLRLWVYSPGLVLRPRTRYLDKAFLLLHDVSVVFQLSFQPLNFLLKVHLFRAVLITGT